MPRKKKKTKKEKKKAAKEVDDSRFNEQLKIMFDALDKVTKQKLYFRP